MTAMNVVTAPDPRLRVKTKYIKKITPKHLDIIHQMEKVTLAFKDPEGVGLAATQIGKDEQYFILKHKDGSFEAIFNPEILQFTAKTKVFFEGCLSIPNYYGEVVRPIGVTVRYQDVTGKKVQKKLVGLEAWIYQHEYDHLQGKLFIDKVLEQKGRMFKVVGKDRAGAEIFEEIRLTI
jgi:peptide deformylase